MSESQIEAIKNTKESKFRKTVDGRTIMQGAVKFPSDLKVFTAATNSLITGLFSFFCFLYIINSIIAK